MADGWGCKLEIGPLYRISNFHLNSDKLKYDKIETGQRLLHNEITTNFRLEFGDSQRGLSSAVSHSKTIFDIS